MVEIRQKYGVVGTFYSEGESEGGQCFEKFFESQEIESPHGGTMVILFFPVTNRDREMTS